MKSNKKDRELQTGRVHIDSHVAHDFVLVLCSLTFTVTAELLGVPS